MIIITQPQVTQRSDKTHSIYMYNLMKLYNSSQSFQEAHSKIQLKFQILNPVTWGIGYG